MNLPAKTNDFAQVIDPLLWLITAGTMEEPAGLVATSVTQISISPNFPRYMVALAKPHFTCQQALKCKSLTLHLISHQEFHWVEQLATTHGPDLKKFHQIELITSQACSPVIKQAPAWISGTITHHLDLTDRIAFFVDIEESHLAHSFIPLTWSAYLQLIPEDLQQKFQELLQSDILRDEKILNHQNKQ